MVEAWSLAFDIASVAVSTALPGIAWALLFGVAWRRPRFAESLGLGPRTFWLLLPGAILASFALLPIAPVSTDIVAVSFAGAVFPLAAATLALAPSATSARPWAIALFGPLSAETGALLAVVLLGRAGALEGPARALGASSWTLQVALVALLAALATVLATVAARSGDGPDRRPFAAVLGLTSAALVLTYLGAQAIPGVGITEPFPYFLVPPILVGVVAVAVAPRAFPGGEARALPAAFFAASWGVTLGADVLCQPSLYGSGPSGLYAIGGAGTLDLVYLSAFLGLLGAWETHRLLGRSVAPVGPSAVVPEPSPSRRLREAFALAADGLASRSVDASAAAARGAALQAHRLLGRPVDEPARPWVGLPVPGWVVSDQANLESVARAGPSDVREAWRAFATARGLVRLGEAIGRPRFASIVQRAAAFAIDTAVLGAVAAAIFVVIVLRTPGGLDAALASIPFNAAIYGFVAAALVYFAGAELWTGATLGKALMGIEVRGRDLEPVDGLAAFVRNAPLLPVVTLYALGLALSIAIAIDGIGSSTAFGPLGVSTGALAIVGLGLIVLAGIALASVVGIAAIAVSGERQRVGDLWAGTWVVRRLSARGPPASSASPAAGRSG